MNSLEGKVAVVTGASRGIGAALAEKLRCRGARLALIARDLPAIEASAAQGDLVVPGDLTNEAFRAQAIARIADHFGAIDILIDNAGRGSYYSASTAPLADARDLFELNFFAPMHLAQLAIPFLRQSKGILVNVISIAGQISLPWLPIYSASKFALASLSATQRMELRSHGISVVAVFPGYVDTEFQAHAAGPKPPGSVVKGKRFAVSAGRCADAIVNGIERRKNVVVTPAAGWALIWAHRLIPGLVESRMRAQITPAGTGG